MVDITITIPTLNEEGNIENCLHRLNSQKRPGDEIIVVDGGSDDSTVEICKSMGAKVYTADGSSIGSARHIGVLESDNEVIATTDADALPPDGWLSKIRQRFMDDDLTVLWGNIQDKNGIPIRNLIGKFSTFVGGASGNNTAYRKSDYMELDGVYPDINFSEDFVAIARLALHGKAVRDNSLVMVMDMDRDRYQKKPLLGVSVLLVGTGLATEGKLSQIATGTGLGVAATELTYEGVTDTPLHHDQVGAGVAAFGSARGSNLMIGTGAGLMAHHILTEGLSAVPTALQTGTDIVMGD